MSDYRKDINTGICEARGTFLKGLPLFILVVVLSMIGFGLNSLGLIGSTAVQREVFKQSYQRSAALESRLANDEAVMAESEAQLRNTSIDSTARANLNAQLVAGRVRLNTTRRMMK